MAGLVLLVLSIQAASVRAQSPKYPPLSELHDDTPSRDGISEKCGARKCFGACHG